MKESPSAELEPRQQRADFVIPDFGAPLDFDAHQRMVPTTATVKGVITQSAVAAVRAAGLQVPRAWAQLRAYRDVTMREHNDIVVECARALHPDLPPREQLRRIGRLTFPAFTATLVGRVMYGVFGRDVTSIFRLAQRSFEITQNTGKVETTIVDATAMILRFSETYTFLDSYHFGVLEGTLDACKLQGIVSFKMITPPHTGEVLVTWNAQG